MKIFKNKTAVVTGAANGIGKAVAKKCLQRGMKVVLVDMDVENLKKCEQELSLPNADLISVVTDVSDDSSVRKLAETVVSHFGRVHLLFNNAGIPGSVDPIWELDISVMERVMKTNFMGVVYGLHTFIPIMLKQNDDCHIVNTASGAGLYTSANVSTYSASKYGVVGLTEVLYYDLKKHKAKINISLLCPASVKTKIAEKINTNRTDSSENNKVISLFKARINEGMLPEEVAEKTFTAIQNKQFYILTHPEQKLQVQSRMEDVLNERNPSSPFLNQEDISHR